MTTKPILSRRNSNIDLAVFEFDNNGKKSKTISITRSYQKKGSDEWTRETIHCFPEDLLAISNLANVLYTDIMAYNYKKKEVEQIQEEDGFTVGAQGVKFDDSIPF